MTEKTIKVLVADDSAVARRLIGSILETDRQLKVVGFAKNGTEAVEQALKLRPDVMTMDIHMPIMDGFEATCEIMHQSPTPIVVVTASADLSEMKHSFRAIQAGALALVEKPRGVGDPSYTINKENLITTVKIMSAVKVVKRWSHTKGIDRLDLPENRPHGRAEVIAIGSSTGGPSALSIILKQLPSDFDIPILIVQHITRGFSEALADWLRSECRHPIRLAVHGELIKAGDILLAPDNYHMGINTAGRIILSDDVAYNHHCPSVNYLFNSVAEAYGKRSMGVILTGMGDDGVIGLRDLKVAGGTTLAQDESSSVVFGMPKAAIDAGIIDRVAPIDEIVKNILDFL